MIPALIAGIASVIVVLITTVGQFAASRNDRALAHQEVDLLNKLQPGSKAATDLELVINTRIGRWRGKYDDSRYLFLRARGWLTITVIATAVTIALGAIDRMGYIPESWMRWAPLLGAVYEVAKFMAVLGFVLTTVWFGASLLISYQDSRNSRRQAHDAGHTASNSAETSLVQSHTASPENVAVPPSPVSQPDLAPAPTPSASPHP